MKGIKQIIFFIILFANVVLGQNNPQLDSLKIQLKKATQDSIRCRILGNMVDVDYDEKTWPLHNKNQLNIALKYVNDNTIPKTKSDTVFFTYLLSAYSNEGFVMINAGDYKKALDYFHKVIELHSRIGYEAVLASVYNNIAGIHVGEGNNKAAQEYFQKCLAISLKINDKYYTAKAYGNLAKTYDISKDYDKAMEYSLKAKQLYSELDDKTGLSLVYNNLGRLYRIKEDRQQELEYYFKAYEINKVIGEKRGLSYNSSNISLYYFEINKMDMAYKYGLESYSLAKELGYPEVLMNQASWMYKLELNRKNWKAALDYYLMYNKMQDSLNSVENTKAALQQQVQFEYEKKKAIDQTIHNKELEVAGEKEKKQRVISIAIGFGLLLVLVFSVLIYQRLRLTNKQKKIIENQKAEVDVKNEIIEEKQKEIIDSINYARRIQYTLLAHDEFLDENLEDYFIYFQPKDIVSGDFYWATSTTSTQKSNTDLPKEENDLFYLAVCDCTGHGVPGAFMSLLSIGFLSEAIKEKGIQNPGEVFNYVRQRLIENISKEEQKDGFDGILLCINKRTKKISYAAANNSPVLISNNLFNYLPTDKMPVGIGISTEKFKTYEVNYTSGDKLYLYTDGYADQFGGPKARPDEHPFGRGKKFKSKQLNELLVSSTADFANQKESLKTSFNNWKGSLEQVDDVCVIGLRL